MLNKFSTLFLCSSCSLGMVYSPVLCVVDTDKCFFFFFVPIYFTIEYKKLRSRDLTFSDQDKFLYICLRVLKGSHSLTAVLRRFQGQYCSGSQDVYGWKDISGTEYEMISNTLNYFINCYSIFSFWIVFSISNYF